MIDSDAIVTFYRRNTFLPYSQGRNWRILGGGGEGMKFPTDKAIIQLYGIVCTYLKFGSFEFLRMIEIIPIDLAFS